MTPNEETGRRFCMLSEFMFGKPVFESYKSLCSKIGDETISYQEFDFWFHRFAQGKLDLSYDRSSDPKPKELSDMPVDVIDNIVDHLSLLERLPVRNVSRDLRALIDKRINSVKRIIYSIDSHDTFTVIVDDVYTNYRESNTPITFQPRKLDYYNEKKVHVTFIDEPDAMKNSLIHLAHYLKNPNLKLKFLSIGIQKAEKSQGLYPKGDIVRKCYRKLEVLLQSLQHQISTETFDYGEVSDTFFLVALKSFKPGVLEVIHGEAYWYRYKDYDVMGEIVETEQWKQAKRFISWGNMPVIVDGVAHFEEFTMTWSEPEPESVIRLKEVLSASKTFKTGELLIFILGVNERDFASNIVEALGPRMFRYPENPLKWSYPIPDTNEFLDFHQDGSYFHIERTT